MYSNACIDMHENMSMYRIYFFLSLRRDIGRLKNVKTDLSTFAKKQGNLTMSLLIWNQVVLR